MADEHAVLIELPDCALPGDLALPAQPRGLVVFVHGSGSSRRSSRNRLVARGLQQRGFATLLFDLLTEHEDLDPTRRFDVALLTQRLLDVTGWVRNYAGLPALPLAYFGASTGAAAALSAAAKLGDAIAAVVSRGGRPDLALDQLRRVHAPTLLIVGADDDAVLDLNRKALARLRCVRELAIVPGATHLFEEPGALEDVARRAGDCSTGTAARWRPQPPDRGSGQGSRAAPSTRTSRCGNGIWTPCSRSASKIISSRSPPTRLGPSSMPSIQNSTNMFTPDSPKPAISQSGRISFGRSSPLITWGCFATVCRISSHSLRMSVSYATEKSTR